jgi:hypothetical protein
MTFVDNVARWSKKRASLAVAPTLVIASTLLVAPEVWAQSSNDAAARALFAEGRKLSSEGKWQEACAKFEESLRLVPGTGTRFNLADCWEHVGRTASAWSAFLDVVAEAKAAGQADREKASRERADALAPKVPKLVIQVMAPEPGLSVQRNGVAVGEGSWGSALPVDPGTVTVQASAPGKKAFSQEVVAAAGATITVQVPALEADAAGDPSAAPPAPPPAADVASSAEPTSDGLGTQKTIALVVGGVGVVGVAVGTIFFFQFNSKNDDAKAVCPSGVDCEPGSAARHEELVDEAKSARTLTYVGWGLGAAALGGAAVLYFTAPPGENSQTAGASWSIRPTVAPGAFGASVGGRF